MTARCPCMCDRRRAWRRALRGLREGGPRLQVRGALARGFVQRRCLVVQVVLLQRPVVHGDRRARRPELGGVHFDVRVCKHAMRGWSGTRVRMPTLLRTQVCAAGHGHDEDHGHHAARKRDAGGHLSDWPRQVFGALLVHVDALSGGTPSVFSRHCCSPPVQGTLFCLYATAAQA